MKAFIDKVEVKMQAGRGGHGMVSFRHEKFVSRGGPDGGDGGRGGSVIIRSTRNLTTLSGFRHHQALKAQDGQDGAGSKCRGASGEDLLVAVPVGTQIFLDGKMIVDLIEDEKQQIVAKGGRGGFGNAHFISSTRQAPQIAERGEPGESGTFTLELKLLADVGLVGLPNCGKSTLLSVISNARPAIADYPFTTLSPNLGVVDIGDISLLVADIPGLIEGASQGKGLGDDFLRHIERTAVIVHLVDSYQENVSKAYQTVSNELRKFVVDLSVKPSIVALSRCDGLTEPQIARKIKQLQKITGQTDIYAFSSHSKRGLNELLGAVAKAVASSRKRAVRRQKNQRVVVELAPAEDDWWIEPVDNGIWMVRGQKMEGFAKRTDFNNRFGVERLRNILVRRGVMNELLKRGAQDGDRIQVGSPEYLIIF